MTEATTKESAAQEEKKEVVVPEKFKTLVDAIKKMSVLDLAEFVKILEDIFGVSAAAPMMVAGALPAAGQGASEAEEKTAFNVELTASGGNKIAVIKVVREVTQKGLKDAKDLVDKAPSVILEGASKADAEKVKKQLEAAGAKVTLK